MAVRKAGMSTSPTAASPADPHGPGRGERGKLGVYTNYLRNRWNVLPAGDL